MSETPRVGDMIRVRPDPHLHEDWDCGNWIGTVTKIWGTLYTVRSAHNGFEYHVNENEIEGEIL